MTTVTLDDGVTVDVPDHALHCVASHPGGNASPARYLGLGGVKLTMDVSPRDAAVAPYYAALHGQPFHCLIWPATKAEMRAAWPEEDDKE